MGINLGKNLLRPLLLYAGLLLVVVVMITVNIMGLHNLSDQNTEIKLAAINNERAVENFIRDLEKTMDIYITSNKDLTARSSIVMYIKLDVVNAPLTIRSLVNQLDHSEYFEKHAFVHEMLETKIGYMNVLINNEVYRSYFYLDQINDTLNIYMVNSNQFLKTSYGKLFIESYEVVDFDVLDRHNTYILKGLQEDVNRAKTITSSFGYQFIFEVPQDLVETIRMQVAKLIALVAGFVMLMIVIIYKLTKVNRVEKNSNKLETDNINYIRQVYELEQKLVTLQEDYESLNFRHEKKLKAMNTLKRSIEVSDVKNFEAENMASLGRLSLGMVIRSYQPLEDVRNSLQHIRKYLNSLSERFENRTINDSYFNMLRISYFEELDNIEFNVTRNLAIMKEHNELITDFEERRLRKVEVTSFIDTIVQSFDVRERFPNIEIKIEANVDVKLTTYPSLLTQLIIMIVTETAALSIGDMQKGNIWFVVHESNDKVHLTVLDDGDRQVRRKNQKLVFSDEEWEKHLSDIHDLVKLHLNGNINVTNRKLKGIEYNIEFPKNLLSK